MIVKGYDRYLILKELTLKNFKFLNNDRYLYFSSIDKDWDLNLRPSNVSSTINY
jgi:hypothetical protein